MFLGLQVVLGKRSCELHKVKGEHHTSTPPPRPFSAPASYLVDLLHFHGGAACSSHPSTNHLTWREGISEDARFPSQEKERGTGVQRSGHDSNSNKRPLLTCRSLSIRMCVLFIYFFYFIMLEDLKTFLAGEGLPLMEPLLHKLTYPEPDLLCLAVNHKGLYTSALMFQSQVPGN